LFALKELRNGQSHLRCEQLAKSYAELRSGERCDGIQTFPIDTSSVNHLGDGDLDIYILLPWSSPVMGCMRVPNIVLSHPVALAPISE
jgi:hypothetical protein